MVKFYLHLLNAILFTVSIISCHPFDQGFTFIGEYKAPQSGFLVRMAARGNIKGGSDVSDKAYSLVRICPLDPQNGMPFEMSLTSLPEESIIMESKTLNISKSEWNWKTSEKLLKEALDLAGYNNIINEEVAGSVRVINGSLAGPKGTILKGQIESMEVLIAEPGYGVTTKQGNPTFDWIKDLSLESCEKQL
jgi:hypothetical protein